MVVIHPDRSQRKSLRIPGYDYAQTGAYFITVCTFNKALLFGEIIDGNMEANENGIIVADEWRRTETVRSHVALDAFVVMPNHLHAIIFLDGTVGATRWVAHENRQPLGPSAHSIGAIVGQFKSVSTRRINAYANTHGNRVWQRNYYEHVIRDEADLERIREYIVDNPAKWDVDRENPIYCRTGRATHRVAPTVPLQTDTGSESEQWHPAP